MEQKILEFVSKLNAESFGSNVDGDTDLFDSGVVDSFGLVDLVAFLEREMGRALSDDDINDPRFSSASGIASMLAEKAAAFTAPESGEQR